MQQKFVRLDPSRLWYTDESKDPKSVTSELNSSSHIDAK
jgi:hypothetical protein